jgi:hypothetical protein
MCSGVIAYSWSMIRNVPRRYRTLTADYLLKGSRAHRAAAALLRPVLGQAKLAHQLCFIGDSGTAKRRRC